MRTVVHRLRFHYGQEAADEAVDETGSLELRVVVKKLPEIVVVLIAGPLVCHW